MRSAQVTIVNRGNAPATYRITFKNMRMKEDGSYEDVEEPHSDERFAAKMIRYSPRQVVLEPGGAQTVRLLVRKPRDLPAGEYRSHLLFRVVPPENIGEDIEAIELQGAQIRARLFPIFGVTIPVIVRHGDLSATVTLSDLALKAPDNPDRPLVLSLRLNRSGDSSAYGDITVTLKPNGGGETQVGLVRGIAVYTPNESRTAQLPLRPPEGVELKRGSLHVVYRARVEEGGAVLAEAQLRVP